MSTSTTSAWRSRTTRPITGWWFDPATGELELWPEEQGRRDERQPEDRGLVFVEPTDSRESYSDMEDFAEVASATRAPPRAVDARRHRRARRVPTLQGHPARFPGAPHGVVPHSTTRGCAGGPSNGSPSAGSSARTPPLRAAAASPDPAAPALGARLDARGVAQAVAHDLSSLYGDRLRAVGGNRELVNQVATTLDALIAEPF